MLNLSGRIGLPRLLEMIVQYEYAPTVVYETVVRQCDKTSIAFYAALETCLGQEGVALDSEFFLDAEGREQITAREAERIRHARPDGVPVS
jgi:hypothetical protein